MKEEMRLSDLKKWINKLTDEELQSGLHFNSDDYSIFGLVDLPEMAPENYYYIGGEYPGPLFTKEELLSDGYNENEINAFTIVIAKGTYFLNLEIERNYKAQLVKDAN